MYVFLSCYGGLDAKILKDLQKRKGLILIDELRDILQFERHLLQLPF